LTLHVDAHVQKDPGLGGGLVRRHLEILKSLIDLALFFKDDGEIHF
jgi:hypothetical protein